MYVVTTSADSAYDIHSTLTCASESATHLACSSRPKGFSVTGNTYSHVMLSLYRDAAERKEVPPDVPYSSSLYMKLTSDHPSCAIVCASRSVTIASFGIVRSTGPYADCWFS